MLQVDVVWIWPRAPEHKHLDKVVLAKECYDDDDDEDNGGLGSGNEQYSVLLS